MGTQLRLIPLAELKATPRAMRRHSRGQCATPRCRNKYRNGGWFCHACTGRDFRWRNPISAYLRDKKQSCKTRHILWLIPDDWFKTWATEKGLVYHMRHEDFALRWRVDRIRSDEPYTMDNIQCMPHGQNSIKEQYRRKYGSDAAANAFAGIEVDQETGEIMTAYKLDASTTPIFAPVAPDNDPPF